MQALVSIIGGVTEATVTKVTEKRTSIPPNAAPRADVELLRRRVEDLGYEWNEAIEKAGLGRATAYRFLKGTASVGSLRAAEEWVVKEESKRRKPSVGTKDEQSDLVAEWMRLGESLMKHDPAQFLRTLDGLRDLIGSIELQQRAITKMFRATPDSDR